MFSIFLPREWKKTNPFVIESFIMTNHSKRIRTRTKKVTDEAHYFPEFSEIPLPPKE